MLLELSLVGMDTNIVSKKVDFCAMTRWRSKFLLNELGQFKSGKLKPFLKLEYFETVSSTIFTTFFVASAKNRSVEVQANLIHKKNYFAIFAKTRVGSFTFESK